VSDARLEAIVVTPSGARLAASFTRAYLATGSYSDGSQRSITDSVTWSSSDVTLASVSNSAGSRGVVTGVAAGTVNVIATQGSVSAGAPLTVTNATLTALQVNPTGTAATPLQLPLGNQQQFTVTGLFSDSSTQDLGTQVAWTSSDTTVAAVSAAGLLTTAKVGGPITVTAAHGAIKADVFVTVTDAALTAIAVTPATPSIPKGSQQAFKATGSYTDGSTADITGTVSWTSSQAAVASIEPTGVATGVTVGNAVITAASGGVSGATTLTVSAATLTKIEIGAEITSIPKGARAQYSATGTYTDASTRDVTTEVTWASSDASVVTVVNAGPTAGEVQGIKIGSASITASGGGVSDAVTVAVTNAVLTSIEISRASGSGGLQTPIGTQLPLKATGVYSDATTKDITTTVTWGSADTTIVEVSNGDASKGVAIPKKTGTTQVIANLDAVNNAADFTVTAATLNAIRVLPVTATLPIGYTVKYAATGVYSDGERDISAQVAWTTLDPAIVTIDDSAGANKGLAKAVAGGGTTVQATLNSVQGTATVTAVDTALSGIALTPADTSIGQGETLQYAATGTFANGSTLDLTTQVTWASSNRFAATISNTAGSKGLATAGGILGTTTISATSGAITGNTTLDRIHR
ncbi:MAG: beta strand repeat-containing protein, partial [Solimonas sp.]